MASAMDEDGDALLFEVSDQPLDVAFHPREPIVLAGVIDGHLEFCRFGPGGASQEQRHRVHEESCRGVLVDAQGRTVFTCSTDKSICAFDLASGAVAARLESAHKEGINRMCFVSEAVLATGDDDGHVKLWDTRGRSNCGGWRVHKDFVADMHHAAHPNRLLTSSGDGTLAKIDLTAGKVEARSDDGPDELLSVVLMKKGKKVVCGSQDGLLSIFDYNDISDFSERFPGHPESIDALVAVTEDMAVSGSSDGLVRVLSVGPNKLLGVVGVHSDFPIERLALSACKRWLASASHDQSIKIWDVAYLQEVEEDGGEEGAAEAGEGEMEADSDDEGAGGRGKGKKAKRQKGVDGAGKEKKGKKGKGGGSGSAGGFFADLA